MVWFSITILWSGFSPVLYFFVSQYLIAILSFPMENELNRRLLISIDRAIQFHCNTVKHHKKHFPFWFLSCKFLDKVERLWGQPRVHLISPLFLLFAMLVMIWVKGHFSLFPIGVQTHTCLITIEIIIRSYRTHLYHNTILSYSFLIIRSYRTHPSHNTILSYSPFS